MGSLGSGIPSRLFITGTVLRKTNKSHATFTLSEDNTSPPHTHTHSHTHTTCTVAWSKWSLGSRARCPVAHSLRWGSFLWIKRPLGKPLTSHRLLNSSFPITSSISSSPFLCQMNNQPPETKPTMIFSPMPSIPLARALWWPGAL